MKRAGTIKFCKYLFAYLFSILCTLYSTMIIFLLVVLSVRFLVTYSAHCTLHSVEYRETSHRSIPSLVLSI